MTRAPIRSPLPLALLVPVLLCGCKLVDQTTFDPGLRARMAQTRGSAAAAPDAAPTSAPARSGPPPLLTIRFEGSADYELSLRQAVAQALARKPDVRFSVVTIVPQVGSLDDQVAAIGRHGGDARRVASDILADGVDSGQVELGARAEPGVTGHEVRVYVR